MPENVMKTSGTAKANQPDKGGGNAYKTPVFGIVKDNVDPTKAGRIKVFIGEPGAKDSDSSSGWVTVNFLSSYFGRVTPTAGQEGLGTYKENPSSYGMWQSPPDIGTKVLCIFVNGDPNYGFYIGGVPEPEALQMLPAIGSSDNIVANEGEATSYGGATRLPVTNINTNDKKTADSNEFLTQPRPVHSYTASIMNQQGILRDPIRGPISSSASREAASRVGWGVSTPGRPIYEGGYDDESITKNLDTDKSQQQKVVARRGGHSIVMDDGDVIGRDQLIRIRTALGHQILMSDDGQTLMILHSNGQSYVELGKEGTVDIYSTNSINLRTQGDLNLHADQNVNIHAANALNLQGKTVHINAEETFKQRAGTDISIAALNNYTVLAGGGAGISAGGEASLAAGGAAFVNGSKVNLNSGAAGLAPAAVPIIPVNAQTDTLFDQEKGFLAAPAKLLSITSRAPAHAPWANAGQGVDVKTSLNASSELPPAPNADVAKTNNAAAEATNAAPSPATVASVPATVPVSNAVPTGTTTAVTAAAATQAATGPAAAAVTQGAAVVSKTGAGIAAAAGNIASTVGNAVSTVTGAISTIEKAAGQAVAVVGQFAQTATELAQAGVVKPGTANMINAVASATGNITQALPATVFTGKPGAASLANFVQDVSAQAKGLVEVAQKGQAILTKAGLMNGNEAAGAVAGVITAATTVGAAKTIAAVNEVAGKVSSTVNSVAGVANNIVGGSAGAAINSAAGAVNSIAGAANAVAGAAGAISGAVGAAGAVAGAAGDIAGKVTGAANALKGAAGDVTNAIKAIGAGNAAADLADKLSGLGGIKDALEQMGPNLTSLMDQAKGVASSAYNAIKSKLKPLKAGVPQNLTKIAKEAAAEAGALTGATADLKKAADGAISNITKAGESVAGAISGAAGAVAGAAGSLAGAANAIGGAATSLSSAAGSIAGAAGKVTGAISSVANAAGSLSNSVASVTGELNNAANKIGSVSNTLTTTVGSVTNTLNSVSNTIGTGTSVATGVTNLINNVSGAATSVATSVTSAVNTISGMAGAGPSLASGNLSNLATAAAQVQQGAGAAISSQVASGLSNFVGGVKTVANVVNNAAGAVNAVAGASQLTGLVKETTTAVMNGVSSVTGALGDAAGAINSVAGAANQVTGAINDIAGAVDGVAGKVGGALDKINGAAGALNGDLKKLADKANGIANLVKSGLPAGAAAELESAISSLSAGLGTIKLPTIGFNTVDRGEITKQIGAVLGDPKIPSPNLVGEIKQDVKDSIDQSFEKLREERKKIDDKYIDWLKRNKEAREDLINKINTLPEGDPALKAATEKLNALTKEGQEILKELQANMGAKDALTKKLLAGTPGGALLGV